MITSPPIPPKNKNRNIGGKMEKKIEKLKKYKINTSNSKS
jgi:hypothetical protein